MASTSPLPGAASDLVDVIATAELARRPQRAPQHGEENEMLLALVREVATEPASVLQRLVAAVLSSTGAVSAGLSMDDLEDGARVFRWVATAGDFVRYRGGTMPRDFSPCAEAVARDTLVLMLQPARHYAFIAELVPEVVEVLLAPFHEDGKPVGTLWAISHAPAKRFDNEDARRLVNLAEFASATSALLDRLAFGNPSITEAARVPR